MYTIIGTLVVLGVAVVVHELGHFIVARRNGVRVEEFCIGFPPRIFKIQKGDTQYSIGVIPLGGFVKMAGEDPEAVSGQPDEFFSQPVPARIRIALAGPFGNFVCAYICVLVFLWMGGVQEFLHAPVFGTSSKPEAYRKLGIAPGDRILNVSGQMPGTFSDAFDQLDQTKSWPVAMTLQRGPDTIELRLDAGQAEALRTVAVPFAEPVVSKVLAGSPASLAGISAGDRIVTVNDTPIAEWSQLQRMISASAGETLTLGVIRNQIRVTVILMPETLRQQKHTGEMERVGRIGIQSGVQTEPRHFGFLEGLWKGLKMVVGFIGLFFDVLWRLATGEVSVKLLGGPVGIAQVAGDSLQQGGLQFLMFLGIINANLGFVNLLPFFLVTDGGLIMLFLIEAARRRKMSLKSLERWNKLGWTMVLALLIMATYNDLMIRLDLGEKILRLIQKIQEIL